VNGGRLLDAQLERVVRYAAMAPSVHNTQPWRFVRRGDRIELRADLERHLTATDPDGRQLLMSCGAALLGARLALRSLGHQERVELLPDDDDPVLVARLSLDRPARFSARDQHLLEALPHRRTARSGFQSRPVEPALRTELQRTAAQEGARLLLLEHPGHRRAVANLVAAAERAQQAHPNVRQEMLAWTPGPDEGRSDGIPVWAYPARQEVPGAHGLSQRDFDAGRAQGRLESSPQAQAPLAAVLLTPSDTRRDQVRGGSALHAVLLLAAAAGVSASLHSQVVGLAGLRSLLADEVGSSAVGTEEPVGLEQPQMLLQLGYALDAPATPRRSPAEVIDPPEPAGAR
jgi:nitroreductase